MILNIILIVALAIIAFLLYKKFRPYKKPEHRHVQNTDMQVAYNKKNIPKDSSLALNIEEKLDLSWGFLNNIIEKVIQLFSKPDKDRINKCGEKLAKHGAIYNHNVDREATLSKNPSKTKSISEEKEIAQDKGMSR